MRNNMSRRIRAIIFDLGGTLIDYAGNHNSWPELEKPGLTEAHDYLVSNGCDLPDLVKFYTIGFEILPNRWKLATSGQRNLTIASFLLDIFDHLEVRHPDGESLKIAAAKYERAICRSAVALPHGREVLSELKSNGYKLGLISNTMFSGQAHIDDLKRFGLDQYFDTMLFSADSNQWKPNTAPFESVLEELKEAPRNSVFIGDDPAADVLGGAEAGLLVVHYRSSNRFPYVNGANPDATIQSLRELIPVITEFNRR